MERLTARSENGKAVYRHPTVEPDGWEANRNAVLDRCCQYEDTGLEPDEILTLKRAIIDFVLEIQKNSISNFVDNLPAALFKM